MKGLGSTFFVQIIAAQALIHALLTASGAPVVTGAHASEDSIGSFNHPNCELFIQEDDFNATFGQGQSDQLSFSIILRSKGYRTIHFYRGSRLEDLTTQTHEFGAPVLTLDLESQIIQPEAEEIEYGVKVTPKVRWTLKLINHIRNSQGAEIQTESKSQFSLTIDPDQYAQLSVYERGVNRDFFYQIPNCVKKP
jgi:hypothetical protein